MFYVKSSEKNYVIESMELPAKPKPLPVVTHHIFVVDRSGSMYGEIDNLKQTIEQALAADAVFANVKTTLISFSSHRDVTLHWANVPTTEVMKLDKPYVQILRSLRATNLTSMAQALNMALGQTTPGETTGITLFTDGYANDPSPQEEVQAIDRFLLAAHLTGSVFLNCVGYRSWCDWTLLRRMAAELNGTVVQAQSFTDVLKVMYDTQKLLASNMQPRLVLSVSGSGVGLLVVNQTRGVVTCAWPTAIGSTLQVVGTGEADQLVMYTLREAAVIPKGTKAIARGREWLYGALAIAELQAGNIAAAKALLFSSGNKSLWDEHATAITASALAAMQSDLTAWVQASLTEDPNAAYSMGRNIKPKHTWGDFYAVLNACKGTFLADKTFYQSYRRRSIRRVPGSVDKETGRHIDPVTELLGTSPLRIRSMSVNTNEATIQLECVQDAMLVRYDTTTPVGPVMQIPTNNLKSFRSFTLLSGGEFNVTEIPLHCGNKDDFTMLKPFLRPSDAKKFDPNRELRVNLKQFGTRAVELDSDEATRIARRVVKMWEARARIKLLSALVDKTEASPFSTEQVAALKEVHLTPALYYSAPTTNPYTDREQAIAMGQIDSYVTYTVNFGLLDLRGKDEFRSANNWLQTFFTATDKDGNAIKKPTMADFWTAQFTRKEGGKAVMSRADQFMANYFLFLLTSRNAWAQEDVDVERQLRLAEQDEQAAISYFRWLIVQIGCTGVVPKELYTARFATGEAFSKAMEQKGEPVKLSKAEADGTFYVHETAGLCISVVPETRWYSTT